MDNSCPNYYPDDWDFDDASMDNDFMFTDEVEQNCIVLNRYNNGSWSKWYCDYPNYFICNSNTYDPMLSCMDEDT